MSTTPTLYRPFLGPAALSDCSVFALWSLTPSCFPSLPTFTPCLGIPPKPGLHHKEFPCNPAVCKGWQG